MIMTGVAGKARELTAGPRGMLHVWRCKATRQCLCTAVAWLFGRVESLRQPPAWLQIAAASLALRSAASGCRRRAHAMGPPAPPRHRAAAAARSHEHDSDNDADGHRHHHEPDPVLAFAAISALLFAALGALYMLLGR
jgi:ABC-type nickel/cobalt efflux system permease component RcnA